jgi:AraC-like DNA-binding protein
MRGYGIRDGVVLGMGTLHDPESRSHAAASELQSSSGPSVREDHGGRTTAGGTDTLSDVLRVIRLTGALFFAVDASSPWSVEVPRARSFAKIILPSAQHVISYHIITQGSGWVRIGNEPPVPFRQGDILVIPHEDPYAMCSAATVASGISESDALAFFRAMAEGQLPATVIEGGGNPPLTRYVCGFLGCDARPFNPLLAAMPRLMCLRRGTGEVSHLLDSLIDLTLGDASGERAGLQSIRLRLSELMFVELLRLYLETLEPDQTGWLAGLRDPVVGRAMALLHEKPVQSWSLGGLAREAGVSRSVLAARFTTLVGCAPMQYLARWRVQLAARLLADGQVKVSAVARDVGYESEAAFSRAFKRISGIPPAEWRAHVYHS